MSILSPANWYARVASLFTDGGGATASSFRSIQADLRDSIPFYSKAPADGDTMRYNSASDQWVPQKQPFLHTYKSSAGDLTLTVADGGHTYEIDVANPMSVILPTSPTTNLTDGWFIRVGRRTSSVGTVTIDPTGETINGTTSLSRGDMYEYIWDAQNTAWQINVGKVSAIAFGGYLLSATAPPVSNQILVLDTTTNSLVLSNQRYFQSVLSLTAGLTHTIDAFGLGPGPNPVAIGTILGQLANVEGTGNTTVTLDATLDPFTMRLFNQSSGEVTIQEGTGITIFGSTSVGPGEMVEIHSHPGTETYAVKPIITHQAYNSQLVGSIAVSTNERVVVMSAPIEGTIVGVNTLCLNGSGVIQLMEDGVATGTTFAVSTTDTTHATSRSIDKGARLSFRVDTSTSMEDLAVQYVIAPGF